MKKNTRINAVIVCIACAVGLGISSALLFDMPQQKANAPYVLLDNGGKLALIDARSQEIRMEYDIYTQLLPQEDINALRYGIKVNSPVELDRLLEDYGA